MANEALIWLRILEPTYFGCNRFPQSSLKTCARVTQKQQRHHSTEQLCASSSMQQEMSAQGELPSYMQIARARCAASKRRLSVFEVEKIINEEILSEAPQKGPSSQQRARGSPRKIKFQSVLCTDFPSQTSKSCDASWFPPEPKCSTSDQKHGSRPRLPKLPTLFRMPTWRGARIHNIETS